MSFLSRIFGKSTDDRAAVRPLWHRVVEVARERSWYRNGVADTVPGRFDAITMVLALVLLRMEREKSLIAASARLTELFVDDMDGQLREAGIGDLVVGKHVGKLMGTLGGRIGALREALPRGEGAVAEVIGRNVSLIDGAESGPIAREALALHARIDALDAEALLAGGF